MPSENAKCEIFKLGRKKTFLMDAEPLLAVKLHSKLVPFFLELLLYVFAWLFFPYSLGFSFPLVVSVWWADWLLSIY